MSDRRRGEQKPYTRFRPDRFMQDKGKWYFDTREGTTEGPYGTRAEAELRLKDHIKIMRSGFFPPNSGLALEPIK